MSDRPLTILQLTHQGGGSGSTTIIADLSRQLAWRGHRVLVGCRPDTKLAGLAREAGLGLVPLDFRRLVPLARALEGVTHREGVDVVNSNATRDRRALTWLRWTRRLGRPFVVTRHTMPLTSPAELVAVGLSADRTIAVSHAVARALRRRLHPAARLRVVTNGIDLARVDARLSEADLTAARAALGDLAGRPVVLILARRKDQDVLLRSLAALERPVVVACVGVEPDAELRAAEQTVPARHRVVYVPFTDRSEEHTSELQSLRHLVCRLLLEKKNDLHTMYLWRLQLAGAHVGDWLLDSVDDVDAPPARALDRQSPFRVVLQDVPPAPDGLLLA